MTLRAVDLLNSMKYILALRGGIGEQLRHLNPIGVSSTHRTVPRRWSAHQCRAYDERWHMQGRWPNCALAESGESDRRANFM